MLKIVVISSLFILGLYSFVGTDLIPGHLNDKTQSLKIPNDAVMTFSYDMNVLNFNRLLHEEDRLELRPFQQFQFIPQKQKMHVEGYLSSAGEPNFRIDILEKTNRPWAEMPGTAKENRPELKTILVDGLRMISYDENGEEIISLSRQAQGHMELVDAILKKVNPVEAYRQFISDAKDRGWIIRESDSTLRIEYTEGVNEVSLFIDKFTGLPKMSRVISEDEVTTINYLFDCIDGKFVLRSQRTSVVPREGISNGEPPVEYYSQMELENIIINF